jgi:hypothetical protein
MTQPHFLRRFIRVICEICGYCCFSHSQFVAKMSRSPASMQGLVDESIYPTIFNAVCQIVLCE